jgi:uncharacterized protein (DUF2147 family)
MKRLSTLVVLMALSSAAQAGDSFSVVVGGHRIRIEAPRHCRSASCVSVSILGIYQTRRGRDRYNDDERNVAATAKPAAPAPAVVAPLAASAAVAPVAAAPPPPTVFRPAASSTQEVTAPPPPALQPQPLPPAPPPAMITPPEQPLEAAPPPPKLEIPPRILPASQEVEAEPADTPVGDWRSEGDKGSVRIVPCGRALCGYALHASSNFEGSLQASSNARGEAVLINMKPKTDKQWTGNVYSLATGDTYYGTMTMTGPNTLRVEACAMGRFYCSGNVWTRIGGKTERLITSRQVSPEPRS